VANKDACLHNVIWTWQRLVDK